MNDGSNAVNPEATTSNNDLTGAGGGNESGSDVAKVAMETANPGQFNQEPSVFYHFREMQRRLVEFIKKRVLLLEKALNGEYQKEFFGDIKPSGPSNDAPEVQPNLDVESSLPVDAQMFPCMERIAPEEISAALCDDKPDRSYVARLYNDLCKVVGDKIQESAETNLGNKSAAFTFRKNLCPLEAIYENLNRILSPLQSANTSQQLNASSGQQPVQLPETQGNVADVMVADSKMDSPPKVSEADTEESHPPADTVNPEKDSCTVESAAAVDPSVAPDGKAISSSVKEGTTDVEMAETFEMDHTDLEMAEALEKAGDDIKPSSNTGIVDDDAAVIVLDD